MVMKVYIVLYMYHYSYYIRSQLSFIVSRSGVGSHYGTLSGATGAFSAATKPRDKPAESGKNFFTNPGKIGTGYG